VGGRGVRKGARLSRLRGKCPDCRTLTAVALGPDYECHACGREFHAGLVRVARAWGSGGDAMAEAAHLPLPYPETAVLECDSLEEQNLTLAADLPALPLILGGCCCSHVGAVQGLASRHDRLAVIWLDAHGDLNTPESSPSGNEWGMPLRMLIDRGAVAADDVALIGARNLDPPEEEFIARSGLHTGDDAVAAALDGVSCAYVAFDADVSPELAAFMPEPGGPGVEELERLLAGVASSGTVVGAGFSGFLPDERNVEPVTRLAAALGL
jgi:arginase family enzyme